MCAVFVELIETVYKIDEPDVARATALANVSVVSFKTEQGF